MKTNTMTKYVQTPFDKAFIRAVEYLYHHREQHGKLRSRRELLRKVGILESNYTSIKNAERGVPRDKYDKVKRILADEYDVNPAIWERNQGEILRTPVHNNHDGGDHHEDESSHDQLQKENASLKAQLDEKNKFISFLQDTIKMLQQTIDKLSSKL